MVIGYTQITAQHYTDMEPAHTALENGCYLQHVLDLTRSDEQPSARFTRFIL